jgi:hypothetical protein
MNNTTILMALTFLAIFFSILTYNFIVATTSAGVFNDNSRSCIDFQNTLQRFENNSYSLPSTNNINPQKTTGLAFPSLSDWTDVSTLGITCNPTAFGNSCKDKDGNPLDMSNVECQTKNNEVLCISIIFNNATALTPLTGGSWWDSIGNGIVSIANFFISIENFFVTIINTVISFFGWMYGIFATYIVIFTTSCPEMLPLKYILGVFFAPMIIGISYILIRLLKSLIPMIGGD